MNDYVRFEARVNMSREIVIEPGRCDIFDAS